MVITLGSIFALVVLPSRFDLSHKLKKTEMKLGLQSITAALLSVVSVFQFHEV